MNLSFLASAEERGTEETGEPSLIRSRRLSRRLCRRDVTRVLLGGFGRKKVLILLERRHLGVELGVVVARFHAQPVKRLIVGGILILVIVLRGLRRRVPVLRVGIGGGIIHVLIRGRGLKRAARLSRHGLRHRVRLGLGIGVHVALDCAPNYLVGFKTIQKSIEIGIVEFQEIVEE